MESGQAIWGSSVTDYFIGDSVGALYHYDGTSYAVGFRDPSNFGITSVYESPLGAVAVASSALFTCAGSCTTSSAYSEPSNYDNLGCQVTAVCGSGETIYAVGNIGAGTSQGPVGCLLGSDGAGGWNVVMLSDLPGGASTCTVEPTGEAFVMGQGAIVSYSALNGATTETINWPPNTGIDTAYVTFQAAWTDGVNTFAAGGNRRVFQRSLSGWNLVLNDSAIDPNSDGDTGASFAAIAGAGGEAWALGSDQGSHQAAEFYGTGWAYDPTSLLPNSYILAAWAADTHHFFAVGTTDGIGPLILDGHP